METRKLLNKRQCDFDLLVGYEHDQGKLMREPDTKRTPGVVSDMRHRPKDPRSTIDIMAIQMMSTVRSCGINKLTPVRYMVIGFARIPQSLSLSTAMADVYYK